MIVNSFGRHLSQTVHDHETSPRDARLTWREGLAGAQERSHGHQGQARPGRAGKQSHIPGHHHTTGRPQPAGAYDEGGVTHRR